MSVYLSRDFHNIYWPSIVTCESCGETGRPLHKRTFPPDPDTVYCRFCGKEVPLITESEPIQAEEVVCV